MPALLEQARRRWPAIGIFVLALCVRLAFQAGVVGMDAAPRDDEVHYDSIARSLARGGPYATEDGSRSSRAPAFPLLLGAIYRVFGQRYEVARLAQALMGAAVCPVVLALGVRLFTPPVGILAALVCAVHPYAVFWSAYLLSEPLCVLLATASTWALVKADADPRWTPAWSSLCALSALTRPNMGLLFVFGALWLARRGRTRVAACAGAVVVFCLLLFPWTLRNYAVHGRFVAITTKGGTVLWESNNPYVVGDPEMRGRATHAPSLPEARLTEGLSEADADALYSRLALRFMREHWRELPELFLWKLLRLWNPLPELEGWLRRVAASASIVPIFVLFVAGLAMGVGRREVRLLPLLVPVAAVTATTLIYWGDARIRAPADPQIILIATFGLVSLWPCGRRPA